MADGQARERTRTSGSGAARRFAAAFACAVPAASMAAGARDTPPHYVAAGMEGDLRFAIAADTLRRGGNSVAYDLMVSRADRPTSEQRHILVDCERRVRSIIPADKVGVAGRFPATRVPPGSREALELSAACDMLPGPPDRIFPGLIVSSNGALIAPHLRTQRCPQVVAWVAHHRRTARLVAQEDDITLLQVDGGPYAPMASARLAAGNARVAVTMLGLDGIAPKVDAALALPAGSNKDDPGWPQVGSLVQYALPAGAVWDGSGAVVGFGVYQVGQDGRHAMARMLPADVIRQKLALHGVAWHEADGKALGPEEALRAALAATVPLTCEAAPSHAS